MKGGIRLATTRLIPRHVSEGKSILASIKDSLDYGKNPNKTRNGDLVTAYGCDPRTAASEFTLAKAQYTAITGRRQRREDDVLLYQIRQSFRPGEISPEEANRISYELAMSFTKGKHGFIVCTHEDQKHFHSHIYFNSTALDCSRKFRNFWGSTRSIRRISDRICVENGLSIVENPKPSKGHYGTWLGENKPIPHRDKLRAAIDAVLDGKPSDFAAFLRGLEAAGYTVTFRRGRYSVTSPEQKAPICFRSLKGDYTEDAIKERIAGKRVAAPRAKPAPAVEAPKLGLLIDVQNSIKAKGSLGYERWAKIFNLKQAAQTLILLQEKGLTEYAQLEEKASGAAALFTDLSGRIKDAEKRMDEISALQKHIGAYGKTRDVYAAYRDSGYSRKYLAEHEAEILTHKGAKKAFDALGLKKIPSIKALQQEYAALLAEKKKLYASYNEAKRDMRDILTAKNNVDRLLHYSDAERGRENEGPQV